MKLTIDLPLDVFEALATHAIHEYRHTQQQAAYLLTRWVRDEQDTPRGTREESTGGDQHELYRTLLD